MPNCWFCQNKKKSDKFEPIVIEGPACEFQCLPRIFSSPTINHGGGGTYTCGSTGKKIWYYYDIEYNKETKWTKLTIKREVYRD